MKVVTVVGARPQFIKAAVVSHILRKKHTEVLVHTGQHYDYNMSGQFFEELEIPQPDYNLGISGGTHAQMTGQMLIALEEVLLKEQPDWLLIYGDTNSTLAAALAAAKLHIPICHVEACIRARSLKNPEEINRVCTDHVASLLLTSTKAALGNAKSEGLEGRAFFVGNTMYDAFLEYSNRRKLEEVRLNALEDRRAISVPQNYYYMSCHREENTHDDNALFNIMAAMNSLDSPTIYPVHPRNRDRAIRIQEKYKFDNVILTEPIGYLESMALLRNSIKVVTDSGGLQTEAFFAGKKCVTIFDSAVWPETMVDNRNELAKPNREEIIEKLSHEQYIDPDYQPFGDGHAAENIVDRLETTNPAL